VDEGRRGKGREVLVWPFGEAIVDGLLWVWELEGSWMLMWWDGLKVLVETVVTCLPRQEFT
jgi:hypothetical protein